ncbi:hypothetical protein [Demequina capsici]|uniref:Lipoprotein n=1 Tax=Demequina capsici TaxID=3075620 RepID=A0AA96FAJ1_9MICO|nr:hypothetical protein [Demequina sp. OYTSA14]WNM25166.1 hypothetical protein RN606_03190 [Demequina sp. OYTSA14]
MNIKKVQTSGLALLIAATGALGLAACSSDGSSTSGDTAAAAASCDAVTTDLTTARQAVVDALADDDWAQVMLASDVDAPTVKYGLMVMPFVKTDAASKVTGTVTITDGAYTIEAVDASTDVTCQIDQDGTITEVTN